MSIRGLSVWALCLWLLSFVSLTACSSQSSPGGLQVPGAQKAFVALYLVGSTLEDDAHPANGVVDEIEHKRANTSGYATQDLKEILEGFNPLNGAEMLVAFGGARQQRWQGIRYADYKCLQQDAKDDIFGNADCYLFEDRNVSMSDQATLSQFLSKARLMSEGFDKRYLILWNHGAGFLGYGQDSHLDKGLLTLPQMAKALETSKYNTDLIGFDACLMGAAETLRALQPYARYLVASETLEPAHGWDYTRVMRSFSEQGGRLSAEAFGRLIVDSYISNFSHQFSQHKVLSLYDLQAAPAFFEALNAWSQAVLTLPQSAQINAIEASQTFGVQTKGDKIIARDLQDMSQQLSMSQPGLKALHERLLSGLKNTVIYTRSDGTKPRSNGLSVFGFDRDLESAYPPEIAPVDSFWQLTKTYTKAVQNDTTRPAISKSVGFSTAAESDPCKQLECLEIQDNLGLQGVFQAFVSQPKGFENVTGRGAVSVVVGQQRLKPLSPASNTYPIPVWDGRWLKICDGECTPGNTIFPAVFETELTPENGERTLSASGYLNGQAVQISIRLNAQQEILAFWATPILPVTSTVPVLFSRQQIQIKAGDTLAFDYKVYFHSENRVEWFPGIPIQFRQTPLLKWGILEGTLSKAVVAVDAAGNFEIKQTQKIGE